MTRKLLFMFNPSSMTEAELAIAIDEAALAIQNARAEYLRGKGDAPSIEINNELDPR